MPYIIYPEDHVMAQLKEECQIKLFNDLNLMQEKSVINDLFITQFLSTMVCYTCKSRKLMVERMNVIPINIENENSWSRLSLTT